MNAILIEMAQKAGKNETLCAGMIRTYGERHGMQWEEIAQKLDLDSAALAKLALCRLPHPNRLNQAVEQIAAYLGTEKTGLLKFFQANMQPVPSKPGIFKTLKTKLNTQIPKRYIFALAGLAVIVLVGALIAFSPRSSTATLVVSAGQVAIQTPSHPEQMVNAGQAITVKTGDNLAVKPGAAAQLRFYDGSSVDLSENTQVEVQELATSDNRFRVRLKMLTGRTVSRVLRLLGAGDAFEISTPSSTVSVRGTVFVVQVLDAHTTYIGCDKGVVWVVSGNQQAEVPAGQELTITLNQTPQIQPKPTQEPATPETSSEQNAPPNDTPVSTPIPTTSVPTPLPVMGVEETPAPAATEALNPNGSQFSPNPPVVTSDSSGPQGTPNSPSQVPGKPPSSVPGNGKPPSGGSEPPGKGGEPPGQTKDKPDKGKSGKP
jgi:hypothetical protein